MLRQMFLFVLACETLDAKRLLQHTLTGKQSSTPNASRFPAGLVSISVSVYNLLLFFSLFVILYLTFLQGFTFSCIRHPTHCDIYRSLCRDVVPHVVYTYQVQTISSQSESEPSPPLVHELGATYCGDGRIQR